MPPSENIRMRQVVGAGGAHEPDLPRLGQGMALLENRHRAREIAPDEMDPAELEDRIEDRVALQLGLGVGPRALRGGHRLVEVAELGEGQREPGALDDMGHAEGAARVRRAGRGLETALQVFDGAGKVAERVVDLAEPEVGHPLEVRVPSFLAVARTCSHHSRALA